MSPTTSFQTIGNTILERGSHALLAFSQPTQPVPAALAGEADDLAKTLQRLATHGELTGAKGELTILHCLDRPFQRVALVGLGDDPDLGTLRNAFADAVRTLRARNITSFNVLAPDLAPTGSATAVAQALAEAAPLGCYEYRHYMGARTPPERPVVEVALATSEEDQAEVAEAGRRGQVLGEAVVTSRDLCNLPGNLCTPEFIAEQAEQIAAASDGLLKATVLGPEQLAEEGMNLFLAVAKGSEVPARMICLDYDGDPASSRRIAVVGKCITFDAGGISLKKPTGMMTMKRDMMGGTNVLGLAQAVARLRPRQNLSFVVAAAENMPSGRAYRPGDCYQAMNGKWVEIISTDAEGRLVLADSFTWVQRYRSPSHLIDMATLTGGAMKALGGGLVAGLSNDDGLWAEVEAASATSGEATWRLPLHQPYKKGVQSYFAETKNSSTTPPSTIKAALFLEEWIEPEVRWAHFDIAASMSANRPSGIMTRGATGTGLRLVADLLDRLAPSG